jgi:hypothetical protein
MNTWIRQLGSILRGEATRLAALRTGTISIPAGGLSALIILLGMFYGACMGSFAVFNQSGGEWRQMLATTVKVPLLFFLTLAITFPSLYVFNALVGSRLSLLSVLRLLIAALGVMLAVLASMGTIVLFFGLSTTSYPFMLLLNVVVYTVSGVLGLRFLLHTLHRLTVVMEEPETLASMPPVPAPSDQEAVKFDPAPPPPATPPVVRDPGALDSLEGRVVGGNVRTVFNIWVIVFGLVGAQMGWVLRPFVGHPNLDFEWFRSRSSNFFQGVWRALAELFAQ